MIHPVPPPPDRERAEYRYHRLRAASERFQRDFSTLDPSERSLVERQAERTFELESLVLATPEARDTQIPERRIEEAFDAIRRRYRDTAEFWDDLERNGLDETLLRQALRRELVFDAVMTRVGASAEPVSETDEQLFHELHRDHFIRPEQRVARHILVTVNESYAENSRAVARERIERIKSELDGHAELFGQLALRHSECPTAMEEGRLGTLPRGRLYPELDAVLFALAEGGVSDVVESEIGFHLLWCEHIELARVIAFDEARPRIRALIESRRQRERQKDWLRRLARVTGP